ncbi:MAG: HAMP domain-containing histidine kinase, partial [Deltaproteobacteria bacterium]|nr:HAMP domain-containing histidine kinase [Deltaproteobacteria bacterium]
KPAFKDGVDPGGILRDVHDLYAKKTEGEGILLEIEVDESIRPGRYDPDGVHGLLVNLVGNAIDACRFDPSEGKEEHVIRLRCRGDGAGGVVFEVQDNGAGIPEEYSDKVFEDFFSTKGTEGTGVGLLVVQKVAREHGGSVTFESSQGQGTTFRVHVPSA